MIFLLSFSGLYASDVDYLDSADLQSPVDYGIIVPDNSSHTDAINTVDDNYQKFNKIQNLGNLNAENKSINTPHEKGKKSADINIQPTFKFPPRNDAYYVSNPLYGETFSECYSFDGTNSYLIANFTPGTIVPNEMSFCCWMKLNAINKTHTLFSSRAAVGAGLSFFILSSNKLRFDNGNNSNNASNQTTFNYIFSKDIWYHIAVI